MKIQVVVFWVVTPSNDVVGKKKFHISQPKRLQGPMKAGILHHYTSAQTQKTAALISNAVKTSSLTFSC
jgi:hypothetical protein